MCAAHKRASRFLRFYEVFDFKVAALLGNRYYYLLRGETRRR